MTNTINTLVKLRDGENFDPIIFIHPIGGTLFTYKALISRLTTKCPVYGIQDDFSPSQYKSYETLLAQAQHYIQKIFDEVNTDTISLAGYSSGGSLAFEMAHQCIEYGIKVKNVLLFDTWVKTPFDDSFKAYFQKIILRQIGKLDSTQYLEDEYSKNKWLDMLWERMGLLFSYTPQPTPIPVVLFKALDRIAEYEVNEKENYAWEHLVKSLTVIPVSGNHENILDTQYIDQLSQKINDILHS